jgi:hypothetical protein
MPRPEEQGRNCGGALRHQGLRAESLLKSGFCRITRGKGARISRHASIVPEHRSVPEQGELQKRWSSMRNLMRNHDFQVQ